MKILLLINQLNPAGAEKVAALIASGLQKPEFDVHIFAARRNDNPETRNAFLALISDVPYYESSTESGRGIKRFLKIRSELLNYIIGNEIEIVHSHCELPDILAFSLSFSTDLRLIRTSHNETFFPALDPVNGFIENLVARQFDTNICISEKISIQHHIVQKTIIPNAIQNLGPSWCRRHYQTKPPWKAGIVGRLTSQKNQLQFLSEYRKIYGDEVRDLVFQLYGTGEHADQLRRLGENVSWLRCEGFKSNIEEIYSNCDLVVIPSRHEGLSTVMLEALFRRIPVFSTDVSGAADVQALLGYNMIFHDARSLLNQLSSGLPQITDKEVTKLQQVFSRKTFLDKHAETYRRSYE